MPIKLGVVMDAMTSIHPEKDSTLAMLNAARKRGWPLYFMEQTHLYQENGQAKAQMAELHFDPDAKTGYRTAEPIHQPLCALDVILMRKDPPLDQRFLYTTYFLEQAEKQGVLVVNRPQSLRDCNEKLFATQFAPYVPPLLISANPQLLTEFARQHEKVVFKPLDGMGGASIFLCRADDPNRNVIIETLTQNHQQPIMAQRYIPEISAGDKRILMIDGEPVPYALARIPKAGETRGNLAAGATGVAQPLSERDYEIARGVGPELKARGLLFVGLDVIGDYLTEVNVTSPTGIRELDAQYQLSISDLLLDCIESKLQRTG